MTTTYDPVMELDLLDGDFYANDPAELFISSDRNQGGYRPNLRADAFVHGLRAAHMELGFVDA